MLRNIIMPAIFFMIIAVNFQNQNGSYAAALIPLQAALEKVFPGADEIKRRTIYLTRDQVLEASRMSGANADEISSLLIKYEGYKSNRYLGSAYIDSRKVRTGKHTIMIVVDADSKVADILFLASDENPDYYPSDSWLRRFIGMKISNFTSVRGVDAVTGATISSNTINKSVRIVLALNRVTSSGN